MIGRAGCPFKGKTIEVYIVYTMYISHNNINTESYVALSIFVSLYVTSSITAMAKVLCKPRFDFPRFENPHFITGRCKTRKSKSARIGPYSNF